MLMSTISGMSKELKVTAEEDPKIEKYNVCIEDCKTYFREGTEAYRSCIKGCEFLLGDEHD